MYMENGVLGNVALKDNPKNAKMDRCMILSMPENINQYSWFSTPGLRSIYVSIAQ